METAKLSEIIAEMNEESRTQELFDKVKKIKYRLQKYSTENADYLSQYPNVQKQYSKDYVFVVSVLSEIPPKSYTKNILHKLNKIWFDYSLYEIKDEA